MTVEVRKYTNSSYNNLVAQESSQTKTTLFIAFYNNVDFFKKVFASIETQTLKNFELIICDDGSRSDAVEALRKIYQDSYVPVLHLWHEDRGFFKNEALNRGVIHSKGEYLVFIDADCVLHPMFLEDHWSNRVSGKTLAGRRVNLTPWVSKNLSVERIKSGYLQSQWWWLFLTMFWMKDNNSTKGFRVSSDFLFKLLNRKPRGLVGCNFSVHKADLLKVNGFDMTYHKPGIGEDSDVDFRLSGLGVTPLPFCFRGIQYHLYHKLLSRSDVNEAKFKALKETQNYITENGIQELEKGLNS